MNSNFQGQGIGRDSLFVAREDGGLFGGGSFAVTDTGAAGKYKRPVHVFRGRLLLGLASGDLPREHHRTSVFGFGKMNELFFIPCVFWHLKSKGHSLFEYAGEAHFPAEVP